MELHEDAGAAREAVRELTRRVQSLTHHYGDTVDVRRLQADTARITEDLDLLVGPEPAGAPALEVIEDRGYPPEFWADAESEGIGPR